MLAAPDKNYGISRGHQLALGFPLPQENADGLVPTQ